MGEHFVDVKGNMSGYGVVKKVVAGMGSHTGSIDAMMGSIKRGGHQKRRTLSWLKMRPGTPPAILFVTRVKKLYKTFQRPTSDASQAFSSFISHRSGAHTVYTFGFEGW